MNAKVRPGSSWTAIAVGRPGNSMEDVIPAAQAYAYSPHAFPDRGGFARRRVAGERRCSWERAVAGSTPWRDRRRSGRTGRPRPLPDLKHDAGTIRQPCAGRGGGCWRCFDTTFDIDIGTQPSTATPPRPAHPLGYALESPKPRGGEPAGAFGASRLRPRRVRRPGGCRSAAPARDCRASPAPQRRRCGHCARRGRGRSSASAGRGR